MSFMKKIVGLALALIASTALASKIAVVDMGSVSMKSKYVKDVTAEMEAKFGKRKSSLESKFSEYEKKTKQLQRDGDTLTTEQKTAVQKEIHELRNKVQEMEKAYHKDLQKYQIEKKKKLEQMLNKVITEISEQKKIDILINKDTLLYFNDSLDITDTVVKKLNQEK